MFTALYSQKTVDFQTGYDKIREPEVGGTVLPSPVPDHKQGASPS